MSLYFIFTLALVQGLTEFLPVSSSGHLVLTHHLFGDGGAGKDACWQENKLLDVAVHVGTLFAVLIYFRKDCTAMIKTLFAGRNVNDAPVKGLPLFWLIVIASLPVIIVGALIQMMQPSLLCSLEIMAWMTILFAFVLWGADRKPQNFDLKNLSVKSALIIGLAQCLALVPGVSRSGITMTAARALGFERVAAAKFSLFLAIIAIAGAGTLGGLSTLETQTPLSLSTLLIAIGASFLSGLAAIHLMLKWLERSGFTPFVFYRIILGIVLLTLIYSGAL